MASKTAKPAVSIVIPNWNGKSLMEKNLPYVVAAAGGSQIVVTDDHSDDESVVWLKQAYPHITVVTSGKRTGFSGNVNRGVAGASGEIVYLLNTDVRPEKDFLNPILKHFEDSKVAAVGSLEESHERDGIVRRGRGIARWEKGYFIHSRGEVNKTDTAWVSGGSAAFRRSVWDKLGGMDELYNPFYWEDIDLSYQIQKSGYRIVFEPKSIVHHYHEEGAIRTEFSKNDIKRIAYRNQFMFLWKNISEFSILVQHCLWTPVRLFQAAVSGDSALLFGYILACMALPTIINSRLRASRFWNQSDTSVLAPHLL